MLEINSANWTGIGDQSEKTKIEPIFEKTKNQIRPILMALDIFCVILALVLVFTPFKG